MPRDLLTVPPDRTKAEPLSDSKTHKALAAKVNRLKQGRKVGHPRRVEKAAIERGILDERILS